MTGKAGSDGYEMVGGALGRTDAVGTESTVNSAGPPPGHRKKMILAACRYWRWRARRSLCSTLSQIRTSSPPTCTSAASTIPWPCAGCWRPAFPPTQAPTTSTSLGRPRRSEGPGAVDPLWPAQAPAMPRKRAISGKGGQKKVRPSFSKSDPKKTVRAVQKRVAGLFLSAVCLSSLHQRPVVRYKTRANMGQNRPFPKREPGPVGMPKQLFLGPSSCRPRMRKAQCTDYAVCRCTNKPNA